MLMTEALTMTNLSPLNKCFTPDERLEEDNMEVNLQDYDRVVLRVGSRCFSPNKLGDVEATSKELLKSSASAALAQSRVKTTN